MTGSALGVLFVSPPEGLQAAVLAKKQHCGLAAGDSLPHLRLPAGTAQWDKCIAGTRLIHAFGGKRITTEQFVSKYYSQSTLYP
jgi:hypothetical protein